ncbi:MAG: PhzF family phenazine biosynthesis protein [Planctomycetota bacterium]
MNLNTADSSASSADRTLPILQVDAFAASRFRGNPAAVVPLTDDWLDAELMQAIALENHLSETAFFHGSDGVYQLRWFTPTLEVELCGHATLASGYVVLTQLEPGRERVTFESRSGPLHVTRQDDRFALDFPTVELEPCDSTDALVGALGADRSTIVDVRHNEDDHVVIFESESAVRAITPNFEAIEALPKRVGCLITGPADDPNVDYVCRYFAPSAGVPEDPATGSAQCRLAPIWSERLGKKRMVSHQISRRGGELFVDMGIGEGRVEIAGRVIPYLVGEITV